MIRSFCAANKSLSNRQLKWKLLKYELRKFTINYTKQIAKRKTVTKNKSRQPFQKLFQRKNSKYQKLFQRNLKKFCQI